MKKLEAVESPEAWLEKIRQLRDDGQMAAAKEELAAFRSRYPGYALPEDLNSLQ